MKYYQKDKNVMGRMIEVNRELYMKDSINQVGKSKKSDITKNLIRELINMLEVYLKGNLLYFK